MKQLILLTMLLTIVLGCSPKDVPHKTVRFSDPGLVVGRIWQWVSTVTPKETITAASPERYSFLLSDDGRVKVKFDCNNGGGNYKISPGKLVFSPLFSTKMACPDDSQDRPFMRDLPRVVSFFMEDDLLYLELPMDSGTMTFKTGQQ